MYEKIPLLVSILFSAFMLMSMRTIDLANLYDYANTNVPYYIDVDDNTPLDNVISNEIATLGNVLFYDKHLSLNSSIACASCHIQAFAFGDTATVSKGFDGGLTNKHAPRLVNISYHDESEIFWDSSVSIVEAQPEMTLANSIEMGFSGANGQPDLDSLINRLSLLNYYQTLFEFAYGDDEITVERINKSLAQFVRSIVSFDSKFDAALVATDSIYGTYNILEEYANFTEQENSGKFLFNKTFPFGCGGCHRSPHFGFVKLGGGNNGVIGVAGDADAIDITNVRSPSLRDLVNPQGLMNGPFMHDGSLKNIEQVMEHYSFIPKNPENTNQNLFLGGGEDYDHLVPMSDEQVLAVEAFLKTLTGKEVYTNPKWSNPFNADGTLTIISNCNNNEELAFVGLPISVANNIPVSLSATPAGGVFSGEGVVFNQFNPSLVLPGYNTITYTYTNNEGCSATISENILVTTVVFNFVSYQFTTLSPKITIDIDVTQDGTQPIKVANLNGQILLEVDKWLYQGNQKFTLDAIDWAKGIYFVNIGQFSKPEKIYVY